MIWIKKSFCKFMKCLFSLVLSLSLVLGINLGGLSIKAYADNGSGQTVSSKVPIENYPLNASNNASTTSGAYGSINPFKNPVAEIVNNLYKKTFGKEYDKISDTLLDGLFNFFGIEGDRSYDKVDPVLQELDVINQSLESMQQEFSDAAINLSFQQSAADFNKAVNPINKLILGKSGLLADIQNEVKNCSHIVNTKANNAQWDTVKEYQGHIHRISQIDAYDETSGAQGLLNDYWYNLWSLCTNACTSPENPTNLEVLFQDCLLKNVDRDVAINNFAGFSMSWASTCLITNYIMTISNAAGIEEVQLVLDNWDRFRDSENKWNGKTYEQVYDLIRNDSIKGALIFRAEGLSGQRREILNKMTDYNFLVLKTPCYNLTNTETGKSQNFHSFSDLWVQAQEKSQNCNAEDAAPSYVITLKSDVVCSLKQNQQDLYGRLLSKDEDLTTALIKHNTFAEKNKYFRNGGMNLTSGSNIQLNLEGHTIANLNNKMPSIYLENGSSLVINGMPPNDKENVGELTDDMIGQIDGCACDNGAKLSLNCIVFDNVVERRQYVLPEDKPESKTYPSIVLQLSHEDKNMPSNFVYATDDCAVNIENCSFTLTNKNNIPETIGSAINMNSNTEKYESSSLKIKDSEFRGLVSKTCDGAAIKTNGCLDADNCQFIQCSTAGHGGAVCHYDDYSYSYKNKDMNPVTFKNCKFEANSCKKCGGAVFNGGYVKFDNCVLQNNKAEENGGALTNAGVKYIKTFMSGETQHTWCYFDGRTDFNNTVFDSNEAKGFGGAINSNTGICGTGKNSKLVSNHANQNGGAINLEDSDGMEPEPVRCKFELTSNIDNAYILNNTAGKCGGAVMNNTKDIAYVKFTGTSNIVNNIAEQNYGGIYSKTDISLFDDSTVKNNTCYNGTCAGLLAENNLNLADKVVICENRSLSEVCNMDACIKNEGMYIARSLVDGSQVNLCVENTGKHWVTDDKTDQSESGKGDCKWHQRLDNSLKYFHVTYTWKQQSNELIDKDLKRTKHRNGFRDAYYLEWR